MPLWLEALAKWIGENAEWLFSGAGVAVLTLLGGLIARKRSASRAPSPRADLGVGVSNPEGLTDAPQLPLGPSPGVGFGHRFTPHTRSTNEVEDRFPDLHLKRAEYEDLAFIHEVSKEYFRDTTISSLAKNQLWYDRNDELFWLLIDTGAPVVRYVGYFCVIPITKDCVEAIESRGMKGPDIETGHIVGKGEAAAACYIGAIWAKDRIAGGVILAHLRNYLNRYAKQGVSKLYATAAKEPGLNVLINNGFHPLGGVGAQVGGLFKRELRAQ